MTKMMLALLIALGLLASCSSPIPPEMAQTKTKVEVPTKEKVEATPVAHHINTASELKGHWKDFGVVGSIFRDDPREMQRGEMVYSEILHLKLLDGEVWVADLEPNGDHSPLDKRLMYLAHISGDLSKGCGYAMEDFHEAPPQCVIGETTMTWAGINNFFLGKLKPDEHEQWKEVEQYLRSREWKN